MCHGSAQLTHNTPELHTRANDKIDNNAKYQRHGPDFLQQTELKDVKDHAYDIQYNVSNGIKSKVESKDPVRISRQDQPYLNNHVEFRRDKRQLLAAFPHLQSNVTHNSVNVTLARAGSGRTQVVSEYDQPHSNGDYGNYLCDAPWLLVKASLDAMVSLHPNPEFVLWTG